MSSMLQNRAMMAYATHLRPGQLSRRTPPKLPESNPVPRPGTRMNPGTIAPPAELADRLGATWHPPPDRTPRPPKPKGPVPRPQGKPIGWFPPGGPRKPKPKGV